MNIKDIVTAEDLKCRVYMGHKVRLNGNMKNVTWRRLREIHERTDKDNRHKRFEITNIFQETDTITIYHAIEVKK